MQGLKKFVNNFNIIESADGVAFEKFVNSNILMSHQPDIFTGDAEMLDIITVGGHNDMGIDGLAIKVNGLFVKNIDDVEDIVKRFRKANIEIIFIQSKYKAFFDKGEFNNFIAGVRDFLNDIQLQPMNEKIKSMLEIKDYILSDDIIIMWEKNPAIRLYYVTMGKWNESPHQLGLAKQFENDIMERNTFELLGIHFIDSELLKKICDSNENKFEIALNTIDTMPLPFVEDVDNSCIALCNGSEYLKLLTSDDGLIRKTLFDDNVRDYQGDTGINNEMESTIFADPNKFVLLNNGLTIVCDEYTTSNRKIIVKNPQVVNGCQTSHVLFDANRKGYNIDNVALTIKFIATKKLDITNQIVRGTNRQNIVYDVAFETTKQFHKDLEEFFNDYSISNVKLYYERRARQYQHNPMIKQNQKTNMRAIIQGFVGMFLCNPEVAHRHESRLITEYQNKVFLDNHSKLPYYITALTYYNLEDLYLKNKLDKKLFYAYKHHLAMIFREVVAGQCPDINATKAIDDYCSVIQETLKSEYKTEINFIKAVEIFSDCRKVWINEYQRSQFGIKDNADFTKLLLKYIGSRSNTNYTELKEDENYRYTGYVLNTIKDRFGNDCGFISRLPNNIFFHANSNRGLNFNQLKGKRVTYKVNVNPKDGRLLAVDVELAG
ncbi:AIPR family protein [Ruminiclostridium josui]|uniref:AIPR family protein n=1 Tax=Ruminiclostridium josui TaxID=1499 RepID=UPI0004AFC4A5|nr:AIPR family protein [Ruminiclostridium josui]